MQNTSFKTPVPGCGLTIEALPLDLPFSNFDLALFVNDSAEQLNGLWVFNTGLFAATTIDRMSRGFVTLLEHAVQNPHMHLQSLIALVGGQHGCAQGVLEEPEQACNSAALRLPD
jgi:non-ribosomal peptide synthetase component F